MNKTVNINLAGIFFHIDEDAYAKLQHYLDAVKRSFVNTSGVDEILADIEARIAELFSERIRNDRQVISSREVEEVIAIMGQPEDYMVDEEIFEDTTSHSTRKEPSQKQLFRDPDHTYIGGVSSGLGHYLGIQAIWIRLLWILLTIGSSGAFILIYLALWIFVPEAKTTAEKLAMRGEPVTISNIERKIKEGFDDVSKRVKNVDYEKYGYKARSSAGSLATVLGDIINVLLRVFVKLVGILLLLIAGTTLIGLFIGLFTVGTFGIIEAPWTDYLEMTSVGSNAIWIISLLSFFAVGIPFFFLFILGLKILVKNLRTIGRTAKLVLLGLWIISVLGLIFFGIMQATEHAYDADVVETQILPVTSNDTLHLNMSSDPNFQSYPYRSGSFEIKYDANDQKVLYSDDIRLIVRSTRDSVGRIETLRKAQGKNYEDARRRAGNIEYGTSFSKNELILNSYLTTDLSNKFRDQEVQVTLFLPVGSTLYASRDTYSFHRNSSRFNDILKNGDEEKFLRITEDGTQCLDCPGEETEEDLWENTDDDWDNENGISARMKVDGEEFRIRINKDNISVDEEEIQFLRIDHNGIEIRNSKK